MCLLFSCCQLSVIPPFSAFASSLAAWGCLMNVSDVGYSILAFAMASIIYSNPLSCCDPQAHELQPGLHHVPRQYAPLLWGSVRVPCMQFQAAIIITAVTL